MSEQGVAPEIPEDLREWYWAINSDNPAICWRHETAILNEKAKAFIERITALTLERDTLKAERDDALRKSSRGVWRCFHCDEIFDTPGGARDHFGAAQGDTPGCLLKVQLGDERGWLMELRKEQESNEQQLQRALNAEREVETLECRVASLSSDMKTIKPFAKCDSMRDVFNVYDSMEGRALAAEEQVAALKAELGSANLHATRLKAEMGKLNDTVERLSAPVSDKEWTNVVVVSPQHDHRTWMERKRVNSIIAARASTPPAHPISDDEQRRKDAAWNDRVKARCVCGEMIAWYSGEWLHVAGRSGSCADGRLASPAHFLVGMPPA
jgi:regulator of replication initiation timing